MANEARFDPLAPKLPASRARRWFRGIVAVGLLLVLGAVASFLVWRHYALSARDAEIARLRTAGDPVWFADLRPNPLDPAEDGTPRLRQAFAAMTPLPEKLQDEFNALTAPEDEEPMTPEEEARFLEENGDTLVQPLGIKLRDWLPKEEPKPRVPRLPFADREKQLVEKLRPHVEANREAFDLLRQALAKPKIRFELNYDDPQPLLMEFPDDDLTFRLDELLHGRFRCELHAGDAAAATATLIESLALTRRHYAASRDRLMGLLYATSRIKFTLELLKELLERGTFDSTRQAELSLALDQIESEIRLGPAIRGEKAMALTAIENLLDQGGFGRRPVKNSILRTLVEPVVWLNQANYLRAMSAQATYADRYDDEARAAIEEEYERETAPLESPDVGQYTVLTRMAQAVLQPTTVQFEGAVVAVRDACSAARAALAVDAFRRERGRLPKSLDEIGRGAMPQIPRDVVRGESLVYLVDRNGFAICPAKEAEREGKRLAKLVEERSEVGGAGDRAKVEARDGNDGEDGDVPENEEAFEDDAFPSGAFRVVYPVASQANAADGKATP